MHNQDAFAAKSVVPEEFASSLSLNSSSVQEIAAFTPEHAAHSQSPPCGPNVADSKPFTKHHLKSCTARIMRNSKLHRYDSYHVISLHDRTSNVWHTDHHKESIGQGIKLIGGRASYFRKLPHLRGN